MTYSPVGTTLAFCARIDGKYYLIAGKDKVGPYHDISALQFTPDGKNIVYIADNCIIAGKEKLGPFEEDISGIRFSKNSEHYAFITRGNDGCYIRTNNKDQYGPFSCWTLNYDFSPDGETFYCSGKEYSTENIIVYFGGEKIYYGECYSDYDPIFPLFSKNSKYFAFLLDVDWDYELIKDGENYPIIKDLSCGLLYDGTPVYWVNQFNQNYLRIGKKEEGPYEKVINLCDESTFRWLAYKDRGIYLISGSR